MLRLGQAMPVFSRISVYDVLVSVDGAINEHRTSSWELTKRGVLKRERHQVLDAFRRDRGRVARKSLAYDDLDAPKVISRTPEALTENLLSKARKLENFELAILGEVFGTVSITTDSAVPFPSMCGSPDVLCSNRGHSIPSTKVIDL
jgi:hypothetical protein